MAQDSDFSQRFSDRHIACGLAKISAARNFEPQPGSPEGRSPRRVFGYFLHAAKSNTKKRPLLITFRRDEK